MKISLIDNGEIFFIKISYKSQEESSSFRLAVFVVWGSWLCGKVIARMQAPPLVKKILERKCVRIMAKLCSFWRVSANFGKCRLGWMSSFEIYWQYQKTASHREPKSKHRSEQAQASLFWNPDSDRFFLLQLTMLNLDACFCIYWRIVRLINIGITVNIITRRIIIRA